MAVYKVPQDVEADDKLIGPFSFRQFIYLIIVALALAIGWGLWMLFPPLVLIPAPVVIFFGALALPLRKDQPMEVYLAAIVSFYLKPRKRMWDPDGIDSLVQITAPKSVDEARTKDLSQNEAEQRLSYLASLVDTRGWSVRGVGVQQPNSPLNSDLYFEAQQAEDILDSSASLAQNLDYMIERSDAQRHQDMLNRMQNPLPTPPVVQPTPAAVYTEPAPLVQYTAPSPAPTAPQPAQVYTPQPDPVIAAPAAQPPEPVFSQPVQFNPYPSSMHQSVIQPLSQQPAVAVEPEPASVASEPTASTSEKGPSADIMNLANNSDLSIETIAREAHRIHEKEDDGEVVISLR